MYCVKPLYLSISLKVNRSPSNPRGLDIYCDPWARVWAKNHSKSNYLEMAKEYEDPLSTKTGWAIFLESLTKFLPFKNNSLTTHWGGWLVMDIGLGQETRVPFGRPITRLIMPTFSSFGHLVTPLILLSYISLTFKAQSRFFQSIVPQARGLRKVKWLNKVDGNLFWAKFRKSSPSGETYQFESLKRNLDS